MKRVDLATTIHKAVRRSLFEQVMNLGRTNFSDEADCDRALAELNQTLALLREHADHEDQVVFPLLVAHAADLGAELERQHVSLERSVRDIEWLSANLRNVTASEREEVGARLCHRFQSFVVEQLLHLLLEETEANATLWRHYDDAALLEMQGRIRSRLLPDYAARWAELLMSSANAAELAQFAPPQSALPRSA